MLSRTLAAPTLLVASVGVPYVASNAPEWSQQIRGAATGSAQPGAPADAISGTPVVSPQGAQPAAPALQTRPASALTAPLQGPGASVYPNQAPLEGTPTYSLGDVLRMDVSKEWVYQRWPRKSTALADLDLYGVRVPLVTGTQLYDIAGSLTYFFGIDGRVRRISFRGRTGDTTQIASIVHQRFGLVAQPTVVAGEQLLQYRRDEDVLSELRTRPAPVLWASSPHESFTVELELQDPATAKPLVSLPAAAGSTTPAGVQSGVTPRAAGEAKTQAVGGAAAKDAAAAAEAAKAEPLGWKAFFPR
ncbi:MAG: hypothetical protein H0T51_19575, partial [Pirellulales bacterium]|nr:hypothetical protein [Pirellulales bacterium]